MFSLLRCLLPPSPSIRCCLRRWISSRRSSLQRIFRCQIFPCEDWHSQFGVLVFAVLFAWEMAWDSPIVNIVLQTTKTQLFMSALVIDGNLKLPSVECCLETKMRRDVTSLWRHGGHHRIYTSKDQSKMKAATLQLARTHARFTHYARRDYKLTSLGAPRLASRGIIVCFVETLCKKNQNSSIRNKLIKCSIGELLVSLISYSPKNLLSMSKTLTCIQRRCIDPNSQQIEWTWK